MVLLCTAQHCKTFLRGEYELGHKGEYGSTLSPFTGKERGRKEEQKERGREAGIENGWR